MAGIGLKPSTPLYSATSSKMCCWGLALHPWHHGHLQQCTSAAGRWRRHRRRLLRRRRVIGRRRLRGRRRDHERRWAGRHRRREARRRHRRGRRRRRQGAMAKALAVLGAHCADPGERMSVPVTIGMDPAAAHSESIALCQWYHLPFCCFHRCESASNARRVPSVVRPGCTFSSRCGGGVVACLLVQAPAEEVQRHWSCCAGSAQHLHV